MSDRGYNKEDDREWDYKRSYHDDSDYGGTHPRNITERQYGPENTSTEECWSCPKCQWKTQDSPSMTRDAACAECGELLIPIAYGVAPNYYGDTMAAVSDRRNREDGGFRDNDPNRPHHHTDDYRRNRHHYHRDDYWGHHNRNGRDDQSGQADFYERDRERHYEQEKRRRTDSYEHESRRFYSRSHHWGDEPSYRDDRPRRTERRSKDREWPPSFDSSGASYIFDTRSGLFYESSSNFFYDPKTKLYYGNKQKKYYQFSPELNPPFQEVTNTNDPKGGPSLDTPTVWGDAAVPSFGPSFSESSLDLSADDLVIKALGGGSAAILSQGNLDQKKKKIAISLRKSVDSAPSISLDNNDGDDKNVGLAVEPMNVKESETADSFISTKLQKRHESDIVKWFHRGRETKNERSEDVPTAADESVEIRRTATGQPICLICKRKFASVEKLRQHEELSDLHKRNISKQAFVEKDVSEIEYRDRASERRILYPDGHSLAISSGNLPAANVVNEPIDPSQILNEDHIGNKLLQRMGWSGESLGKSTDQGHTNSTHRNVAASNKLRDDWDRIESLAANRG